jgi:hypothetical protein
MLLRCSAHERVEELRFKADGAVVCHFTADGWWSYHHLITAEINP